MSLHDGLETVPPAPAPAPTPALPREPRGSRPAAPTAAPTGQSCAHSPGALRHRSYARPPAASGDAQAAVRVTFTVPHSRLYRESREGSAAGVWEQAMGQQPRPWWDSCLGRLRGSAMQAGPSAWGQPCRRTGLSRVPATPTSDGVARPETRRSSQRHAVPLQDVLREGHGGGLPAFSRGIGERSGHRHRPRPPAPRHPLCFSGHNALKARSRGHR